MNVGLAHNPDESDPALERIDDYHAAAAHDVSQVEGVTDWAGTSNSQRCVHHLEVNVEHGRNGEETKHNLARRLEELAEALRK